MAPATMVGTTLAAASRRRSQLRTVLAPGARMLVSVPYGESEDHGWFRQFDAADVAHLVDASGLEQVRLDVFEYNAEGWQVSDMQRASTARYRAYAADPAPVDDLAAAARAVACIELEGAR